MSTRVRSTCPQHDMSQVFAKIHFGKGKNQFETNYQIHDTEVKRSVSSCHSKPREHLDQAALGSMSGRKSKVLLTHILCAHMFQMAWLYKSLLKILKRDNYLFVPHIFQNGAVTVIDVHVLLICFTFYFLFLFPFIHQRRKSTDLTQDLLFNKKSLPVCPTSKVLTIICFFMFAVKV